MTNNPIADVLRAPLRPDWTVDALAEELLAAIADASPDESHEFTLDAAADRQSRRLLRPLIACLAAKSAAEAGTPANLYGGPLSFKRRAGVDIVGHFENRPGSVCVVLRRSISPANVPPAATERACSQ